MKIKIKCGNCHKAFELDPTTLPKENSIASKAAKAKGITTREVYIDCPECGEETVAHVPLAD